MSDMQAQSNPAEATISVVVTRADGTVEELGVVSYWNKNPLRRLAWRLRHWRKH